MKLDKVCNIDKFSEYYDNDINQKLPHSIKLVVDDIILDVNKVILSWWSTEFENRADEDSELFLTEFIGKYVYIWINILSSKIFRYKNQDFLSKNGTQISLKIHFIFDCSCSISY